MREVRRKKISMIFQDPHSFLNPVLKIGSQLVETVKTHRQDLNREKGDPESNRASHPSKDTRS